MSPDERLHAPAQDAIQLVDYFKRARPDGNWTVLRSTARTRPTLISVLKGLHQLIDRVQPRTAGMFYYAGHAALGEQGLVLRTADCHPSFPNDTGLRLSRILDLFKKQIAHEKYFLLILDCCRSGVREAAVDDIPPNCCVLYACQHGDLTLETSYGGVLTRSLLETIGIFRPRGSSRECPLEFITANLHRQIFSWRPLGALSYEVCGNLVDRLTIPLPEGAQPASWSIDLSLVIRYRLASTVAFEQTLYRLIESLAAWHSLPSKNSPGAQQYIAEQLHYGGGHLDDTDEEDTGLFIDLRVPLGIDQRRPSRFVATVLENVHSDEPESIAIRWPRRIDPAVFGMLKHTLPHGEWGQSGTGGYGLRWRCEHPNGTFRGIAWVDNTDAATSVVLACETVEAVPMPLRFLLPGLADLIDLVLAIRS
jgi:hypothetical protein